MSMGDDDCLNLVSPPMQKACVWEDLLHAQVCEAAHRHTSNIVSALKYEKNEQVCMHPCNRWGISCEGTSKGQLTLET